MTKLQLEKLLHNYHFRKHAGGKHDIWTKTGFPPIPVPRHAGDIPKGTLRNILKAADIKHQ